jgi:hypothetical protein
MPRRKHTSQARRMLADLDAELARVSRERGKPLVWTVQEIEHRSQLAETIDRRVMVSAELDRCEPGDRKSIVAYSTELRLLDQAVTRLLKLLDLSEPAPQTLTSIKSRRAAHRRWELQRERDAAAGGVSDA